MAHESPRLHRNGRWGIEDEDEDVDVDEDGDEAGKLVLLECR